MKSSGRWIFSLLLTGLILLCIPGGITVLIDPYFHFHKPLSWLQYPIDNERYQNDGIVKHFDYDAVITGTSMTQNFRTSELDELFGTHSVKVSFSGASLKEINDNLTVAVNHNPDIRLVVRGIDYNALMMPEDDMNYDEDKYPDYLYDDMFYNDVEYIFNKDILFDATYRVLEYTGEGQTTTTFDEYGNWTSEHEFGRDAVDSGYPRGEKTDVITPITEEDYAMIERNIGQNVTELAAQHPKIQFYLFFPPYSIYYWDSLYQSGMLERQLAAEKYTIELLLEYDNVHLFSFFTEYDMVCDLDNYMDNTHYGEDINSQILVWMSEGIHELTKENYLEYCDEMYDFYMNYDYDALFE